MAGLTFIAQTTEQALVAATTKSLIQVTAPTNQRVKVLGWGIYFDGVNTTILATAADTTTKPSVDVELLTGTVGGTFTDTLGVKDTYGSKNTVSGSSQTIQSVAVTTVTAEPTSTGVLDVAEVNPITGYEVMFDKPRIINGGSFVTITALAADAVNARVKLICEE